MKFSFKHILTVATFTLIGFSASAQSLNSLYFLDNPQSHYLNPALTTDKGWVTLPLSGTMSINSDLGLGSFLYPYGDNQMRTFLHPEISNKEAMSKFRNMNTVFEFESAANILTVGFNAWGGTNSIGINSHINMGMYVPKDVFSILKEGQDADGDTEFKIDNLGAQAQLYTDIALGHARDINDKLTIGAKMKFILGFGYANASVDNMRIHMTDNEWTINHNTNIITSQAIDISTNEDGQIDECNFNAKLGGFGLGFDLGATYKILDNLKVSLAVTDLGFISWNNASIIKNRNESFSYTGFDNLGAEDSEGLEETFEEIGDELGEIFKFDRDKKATSKTTSLYSTLRAGVEYGVLNNKITFGLLSTTKFGLPKTYAEGMLSVNFKPNKTFTAAINGSVSNVRSSIGAVITLGHFFIGADYLLAKYSKQFIPVNATKFNFGCGVCFRFGKSRKETTPEQNK